MASDKAMEVMMSEHLMQAPVILFVTMVCVFALTLGPIAASDYLRHR